MSNAFQVKWTWWSTFCWNAAVWEVRLRGRCWWNKFSIIDIWMSYQTHYWLSHKDHVSSTIQCTGLGTLAVHGFIQHVTNGSETEVIIIGADCSVASQPLANLAQFWNLVQVRHKYMSIIIPYTIYIEFHLYTSIIPMIGLHTGINSFYISSIV